MKRAQPIAWITGILLLGAVTSRATAGAEGPSGPGFWRRGPPPIDRVLERHAAELGLSDAVLAQVREIADAAREKEQPLVDALAKQRDLMHSLLTQDAPDVDSVMRQADEVGAAETAVHKERLRTLLAVRNLLTPDQRAKLVQIFEERRAQMGRGWGHGWRGGPPEPPPDAPAP